MSCPSPARLAAAATGADPAAADHAELCARCGALVDELIDTAGSLTSLPTPSLDASRRAELADRVLVAADAIRPSRRRWPLALGLAAAAAGLTLAIAQPWRRSATATANATATATDTATDTAAAAAAAAAADTATAAATDTAAAAAAAAETAAAAAAETAAAAAAAAATAPDPAPLPAHPEQAPPEGRRASRGAAAATVTALGTSDHSIDVPHNTIRLRDGAISITAPSAAAVQVGSTRLALSGARARAEVRASRGVLVSVQVFAGSVEIDTDDGHRTALVAGDRWEAEPVTEAAWFRRGWIALRAGDHAAAIAAFDRATAPAVAEDAAFWAAVAARRAGDDADARGRFERFLAAFPASPRADAARQHLAALP